MARYITRKLVKPILLLVAVSFVSFTIIYLAPGDCLVGARLDPTVSQATLDALQKEYGLQLPFIQQYFAWLCSFFTDGMGTSVTYHMPVIAVIAPRVGNTLLLSICSVVVAWSIALPLGIYAALHKDSLIDRTLQINSYVLLSIPSYFLALCLLYLIVRLDIPLPLTAATDFEHMDYSFGQKVIDRLRHIILPTIVLSIGQAHVLLRYVRSTLVECMQHRHIVTARAKGLSETTVLLRHALRNGMHTLITCFGEQFGGLLSGAAVTESVLGWPGLGRLAISAVRSRDDPLILGILMLVSGLYILSRLVTNLLLVWSNPQIRFQ